MNFLITGAGLLGCHFAAHVAEQGHQAVIFDVAPNAEYVRRVAGDVPVVRGDVRDLPALLETMQRHAVDAVFHTAGLIGPRVADRPYTGLGINIGGAIAVAEATRLTGVRRLVFASTLGLYSLLPADKPIDEDFPVGVDNYYGASKIASEQVFRAYGAGYRFETVFLRFSTVYGPGHFVGGSSSGAAMHAVVADAAGGKPVRVTRQRFGVGEFVYVLDAVRATALAFEKPIKQHPINVSSGVLVSADDVAAALRRARPNLDISVVDDPAGGTGPLRPQPLDITRARQELGWTPEYDLMKGIADYLERLTRAD